MTPKDSGAPAISEYAILGDCHCCALVSRTGSVDWCCFERFDHRAVFSRLIDWKLGGFFSVQPTISFETSRRYLPGTNVLETRFDTENGSVIVTDCFGIGVPGEDEDAPPRQLLRLIRGHEGRVPIEVRFRPRFDYGLTVPRCRPVPGANWIAYGGADALFLESDLQIDRLGEAELCACVDVTPADRFYAAVRRLENKDEPVFAVGEPAAEQQVRNAVRFWRDWSSQCTYRGPYAELVLRSALVLKALTYRPTGAIVAAPTTSLPEAIGGTRNWDYRYTWVRDANMQLRALFDLGYTREANDFMNWLKRTTAARADELQVAYGIGGEPLIPEFELPELAGYRGSRPVRIGNGAARQFQLDAYGHVVIAALNHMRHGGSLEPDFWEFICEIVDTVERRWRESDQGMWEIRSTGRHFVTSKALAWAAVDGAIRMAHEGGFEADVGRWTELARQIRKEVCTRGVHPETGAFQQAYEVAHPDASLLELPLVGFVDANDPRMIATLEWIERDLSRGALVWRYRNEDGVNGKESPFVLASFWLVIAHAMRGNVRRARELMDEVLARANDVGLFGEEIDVETGEGLGNFPQAFSHLGVISAAVAINRAESRESAPYPTTTQHEDSGHGKERK